MSEAIGFDAEVIDLYERQLTELKASQASKPVRQRHVLARKRDRTKPRADTFLIKRVLTDKVSIFASYPGKGKTSAFVSVAMAVAGLIEWEGLRVNLRRQVVYISEHPEQVEKIRDTLTEEFRLDPSEVDNWLHVVESARMDAAEVVKAEVDYRDYIREETRNGVIVQVKPWIIFDTFASTFDVDDENSNSAISAVVAALKQQFGGLPVTLVMHTSKLHKRGKAEDMTARGASAAEGDVAQVMYLTEVDGEPSARYIEIATPKHRFVASVDAIRIESKVRYIDVMDEFGDEEREPVMYCLLDAITKEERCAEREQRKAEQEQRKEAERRESANVLRQTILDLVKGRPGATVTAIKKELSDKAIKVRGETVTLELASMVEQGDLRQETSGTSKQFWLAGYGNREA